MQNKKVNKWLKKKGGLRSESTGQRTEINTLPERMDTQDLSLSKLCISDITVAEFIPMLNNCPRDLMYEFLDAIETEGSAPMRERASIIEAGFSRINRIKILAETYLILNHEGILAELQTEGIKDPANVEQELKSQMVYLRNLKAQYDKDNSGRGIDADWFEEVLKSISDYKKYYIGHDIKLSRFCKYYQELYKLANTDGK